MKTTENNKLIAEFMNLNIVTLDDIRANKDPYISSADGYTEEELKYDTSWDWLMPVVEKCLTTDGKHYTLNDALLTCNIKEVYQAVVQFINQYNNQ
jgi:hypothetical protein